MKKNTIIFTSLIVVSVLVFIFVMCFFIFLYPLKYKSSIEKYAEIYKLDPAMVSAVINIESGYDKDAESSVGARGLMQIMPPTALEIAKKLGIENYTPELLFSPDVNIRMGCYYLSYLMGMYNSNITNVIASYNAGFNNVNSWLLSEECNDNGTLTNIPVKETKNYVKKYYNNFNVYKHRFK